MNLILDGANIARQGVDSTGDGNQLRAAIDKLLSEGHTLYPVLAQFRMSGKRAFPNMEWVSAYEAHERVHFVQAPSGTDDDSFILDLAIQLKGVIVSNDLFRNHKDRLGKQASRYCGGSKATHRMMFSIAGELFIPDPNFVMPAEEKTIVPEHAIKISDEENESKPVERDKKSRSKKEKTSLHKITKRTVKSAIIQHAKLPMPVSKLGTYIPNLIAKSTGRKVSKRELRDEAGFGNNAWIDIFSRMGPQIEVDRNVSPPIVKFGTKVKKNNQKKGRQKRNSNREKNTDSSTSLELVFHEVIDEKRHHLVSERSFLSTLLPFLKVDEILVFPWSVVCEKHLKRSGQRLAKLSPDELNELLTQVPWPLSGKRTKIVRYTIKENELHLWGR
ncbi:MAG: NYN domain-containing protein [Candidatus Thalassarchaeaceae archaeon]|nr:MAG: hypothetical protein CMA04_000815 [Euryarchaeota archaeon]RPG76383.1 MAG: hypothetical protein CBC45_000615 [Euryarchaeota archaeon TMED85]|tara:strand:- start:9212 stop:10375 length:1164 start_codon:yes stop_codon:yes gene_type:complete